MTRLLAMVGALWMALAGAAWAEKPVVVVELFTSQGCSSCPPADAFLHELAKRDDVLALSLHVDYWDYIGWKDVFGDRKYTQRQHAYAKAGHRRSVYTPQMIIQGKEHVVGNHPKDVRRLIAAGQAQAAPVRLAVMKAGGRVTITGEGRAGGPCVVQLVRYDPEATVTIRRGENAGRTLSYANVVRDWRVVGEWDGTSPLKLEVKAPGALPSAVIVQRKGHGPIVAAARAR